MILSMTRSAEREIGLGGASALLHDRDRDIVQGQSLTCELAGDGGEASECFLDPVAVFVSRQN